MKKVYKFVLMSLVTSLTLVGCSKGISVSTSDETVELREFNLLVGKHCESSAVMNALNYQGLKLSEDMINGLASSISFTFETEGGFPFLGCRTADFKGNFVKATGMKCVEVAPKNSQEAYEGIKAVLKRNIPVVLRVDMRYLTCMEANTATSILPSAGTLLLS